MMMHDATVMVNLGEMLVFLIRDKLRKADYCLLVDASVVHLLIVLRLINGGDLKGLEAFSVSYGYLIVWRSLYHLIQVFESFIHVV